MRVLTVGNLYPPHHFGGYEQVWRSAVGHLRREGHTVRVLCVGYRHAAVDDGPEADVHRALRWYLTDQQPLPIPISRRLPVERHNHRVLGHHLDDLRPDVVSFWSMGGMSHSLIEAVRRRGLPMVAFVHDEWLDYGQGFDQWTRMFHGRPPAAARLVERVTGMPTRVAYGAAGRYVFVSEFVRRRALALGLGLHDTGVAHSGIDPAFLEGPFPPRPWGWRLLNVGRLHPDKGVHDAVAALARLPAEATLTFAGAWDAASTASLRVLISELGVGDRVRLLGHRAPEEVAALYREHDAVLFPVRWNEPWGLVPLEAMASRAPVVATGRGGSAEYLRDGENALLVDAQDPAALAAAVHRLAAAPELRERLRAGGAQTAARHTEPIFNTAVARHLAEVAGR